jgi:hypothetical protein
MTASNPKTLADKTAQYENDSFAMWLEKTNIAAMEEGDLNLLTGVVLNKLKDANTIDLVHAINFTYDNTMKEVRNVLIKAIAMS